MLSSFSSLFNKFLVTFCLGCPIFASAIEVVDSQGPKTFTKTPTRVIALNWGATEELIALGVTPVGVADIDGYRTWVERPALPAGITDVGRRAEPSMELMASLKPDLIVIGSQQLGLAAQASRIAPVLYFDNYREDHNNFKAVNHSFRTLGKVLGKAAAADARLASRDAKLLALAEQLNQHFQGNIPATSVVRFVQPAHARIYGKNSMVEAALNMLGVPAALQVPNSTWGQVQRPITDLAEIDTGVLLYIEPFYDKQKLFAMPLWQFMPFVRNQHIAAVEPSWTYGGAISIEYLGEAITKALLQIQP